MISFCFVVFIKIYLLYLLSVLKSPTFVLAMDQYKLKSKISQ